MTPVRFRRGLLLLLVMSVLPVTEAEGSWWVLGIVVLAAVLSEIVRSIRGRPIVPSLWTQLTALLCVAFLFIETTVLPERTPTILALTHFLCFLGCCKFFELSTNRDHTLLLVIALLLLIVGGLVSGSVVYALVLVANMSFGLFWLVAFHQKRELDAWRSRETLRLAPVRTAPPFVARIQPRGVAFIALLLVITSSVIFITIPRGVGRSLFGRLRTPISAVVTGYTDNVTLTTSGLIENDKLAARVKLTIAGEPYGGGNVALYLRGRTYSRYKGGVWLPTPGVFVWNIDPSSSEEMQELSAAAHALHPSQLVHQEIWVERAHGPNLFSLYPPVAISAPDLGGIEQNCDDLSLRLRRYSGRAVHYGVVSPLAASSRLASILERERRDRTENPIRTRRSRIDEIDHVFERRPGSTEERSDIPERIAEYAHRLVADLPGGPETARVRRMADRIRDTLSGGAYEYTLSGVRGSRRGDRVERFLFETKRGHCEFFASAMTLMCQAVGLDARLVTGYFGGEYNPVGSFYVIRERDAHAWVEVRIPGKGWVTYDPSPAAVRERPSAIAGLWDGMKRFAQYLQFEWVTFVVSFDAEHRSRLLGKFEGWFRKIDDSRSGWQHLWQVVLAFLQGPPELTSMQRVLYWFMLALVVLLILLVARVLWILFLMVRDYLPAPRRTAPTHPREPTARFYDRLLRQLARLGYEKPPELTPREFAARLAHENERLATVVPLTDWYYEAQYGRRPPSEERRQRIGELIGEIAKLAAGGPVGNSRHGRETA